jgi:hypothetical protein
VYGATTGEKSQKTHTQEREKKFESSISKANNSFGNVSENLLFFHFQFHEFSLSLAGSSEKKNRVSERDG